jgi:hypothetical protein
VRIGGQEYRRNRKRPRPVATLLRKIRLRRCIYQSSEAGQEGISPLEYWLGIVPSVATPALADEAARWQADLPQQQTRTILQQRHGVTWADATLRKAVTAVAERYEPHRLPATEARVLKLLKSAEKSSGKHAPHRCPADDHDASRLACGARQKYESRRIVATAATSCSPSPLRAT